MGLHLYAPSSLHKGFLAVARVWVQGQAHGLAMSVMGVVFGFSCGHMVSVYAVAACSVSINIGRVLYGKSLFLCGDLGVSWTYRGIFGTICPLQGALRGEGVHSLLGIGFLLCLSQMY